MNMITGEIIHQQTRRTTGAPYPNISFISWLNLSAPVRQEDAEQCIGGWGWDGRFGVTESSSVHSILTTTQNVDNT